MIHGKIIHPGGDISKAIEVRKQVFVEEQNIPLEIELDDIDAISTHVVLFDDNEKPVGTGRVYPVDEGICMIGRVSVLKECRRKGYGDFAVRILMDYAFRHGAKKIEIHSQVPVVPFYESIGFKAEGDPFEEDTVMCLQMSIYPHQITTKCGHCHTKKRSNEKATG